MLELFTLLFAVGCGALAGFFIKRSLKSKAPAVLYDMGAICVSCVHRVGCHGNNKCGKYIRQGFNCGCGLGRQEAAQQAALKAERKATMSARDKKQLSNSLDIIADLQKQLAASKAREYPQDAPLSKEG